MTSQLRKHRHRENESSALGVTDGNQSWARIQSPRDGTTMWMWKREGQLIPPRGRDSGSNVKKEKTLCLRLEERTKIMTLGPSPTHSMNRAHTDTAPEIPEHQQEVLESSSPHNTPNIARGNIVGLQQLASSDPRVIHLPSWPITRHGPWFL